MIVITKKERDYLVSRGFKPVYDIHRTYGHHKHYYATEREKLLQALWDYRDGNTIQSVGT